MSADPEDVAYSTELGRLFATDVHWMMQREGLAVVGGENSMDWALIPDSRYTRLLHRMASIELARIEQEVESSICQETSHDRYGLAGCTECGTSAAGDRD